MMPASSADPSPAPFKYQFNDSTLLDEALTHKSYVNERKGSSQNHNERLEFLGDAVLSLIVSDYLATRYSQ
ncbi:MAG: ribonuclease III, partial [Nitrospira sp.]|nr:ribonuclease III [Nitrospira sp.]